MFILDSLFLSGFRWVLDTVVTAAEAEMNDDTALREELLAAELRRELGEISDEEFADIEADLLARIREIKERREGGSGPIAFGGEPIEASGGQLDVEATIAGDFHESPPEEREHTRTQRTERTERTERTRGTTGTRTTRTSRTTRTTRTARSSRPAK